MLILKERFRYVGWSDGDRVGFSEVIHKTSRNARYPVQIVCVDDGHCLDLQCPVSAVDLLSVHVYRSEKTYATKFTLDYYN